MALYNLNDVFGYQDANEIKKLWASTDEPTDAAQGEIWLDISTSPYWLKRRNNSDGQTAAERWDTIGDVSSAMIKSNENSAVNADTQWLDGKKVQVGTGADGELYSN